MNLKSYLVMACLSLLFLTGFGQTGNSITGHISIRGPMIISNTPVQYHYHLCVLSAFPGANLSSWSIYPASCGSIISGSQNDVLVEWNSYYGMLIYNNGQGCSDTLFMQTSCPPPTDITFDIKVRDVTDHQWDPPFGNISQVLATQFGYIGSLPIVLSHKKIFIEGVLNLESTGIRFYDCDIYFGTGAVIYAPNGPELLFDHCSLSGVCAMWQGIRPWTHAVVRLLNGTVLRDAEFGLSIYCDEFELKAIDALFKRNFVSIYSPINTSLSNAFTWRTSSQNSSIIQNCTFDGAESIILPTYNGQHGIPIGQKSFAGMLFQDLDLAHPAPLTIAGDTIVIPFSLNPNYQNRFINLNFGIYSVNSKIDAYNCRFENIQPAKDQLNQICYTGTRSCNGSAIYSSVPSGKPVKTLYVGGVGYSGVAMHNEFTDCNYGVYGLDQVDSRIDSNKFLHNPTTGGLVIPSGVGINFKNPDLRNIWITNNEFRDFDIRTDNSPLRSVGIYISSSALTRKLIKILDNTFTDVRLGMYLQNTKGLHYQSTDFMIAENTINSTFPPFILNSSNDIHFGIWLNYVNNAYVYNNTIGRTYSLAVEPSNFGTKMYGMNISNSCNVSIASNHIMEYGTAFRVVSNCTGSTFKCNYMASCVKGVSCAQARLLAQGESTNSWENHWDGFPYPILGSYNRVDGTTVVPVEWYNSGAANSASYYNRFSPEPVNSQNFTVYHNTPTYGCAVPVVDPPNSDIVNAIVDIVNNDVGYSIFPDINRELDLEYAYCTLMDDTLLKDSISDFGNFIIAEQNSNYAALRQAQIDREQGLLSDALAQLDLIYDPSIIEYNQQWTQKIAMNQEINATEELAPELIAPLQELAWTNAWIGGPGVFTARHLLNEEVFDLDRNFRIGLSDSHQVSDQSVDFSFYPNPTNSSITLFYNAMSVSNPRVRIYNYSGMLVLDQEVIQNVIDLNKLYQGVYSIRFYSDNNLLYESKLVIIK